MKIYNWNELPILLDTHDMSLALGLSETQVRKLCKTGAIPAVRIGNRRWGMTKEAFRDYCEHGSTAQTGAESHVQ